MHWYQNSKFGLIFNPEFGRIPPAAGPGHQAFGKKWAPGTIGVYFEV
jgi:hypothetical protein